MKFRIFPPQTMETIYEQKLESPVMITSGQQKFMMHGRNLANTGKTMTPVSPLSPTASASSQSPTSPSLAKKPSQIMLEWVKRSGSGSGSGSGPGRSTKHVATLSVLGHQKLPIVHLGGGRLGESDIEPSFPTGLRPTARNPSIQREGSADSRVTQWIDLYPEAIERMNGNMSGTRQTQQHPKHTRTMSESSTIKQTRWKFHPDHHAAAPPEIDPRPAPLRIPSAKKTATAGGGGLEGPSPTNTTLARSDSKWKPLPILPAQQQATQSTQAFAKTSNPNGIPARKPLQVPQATEAIQLPKRNNSPETTAARPKTPTRHATDPGQTKTTTSAFPPPLTIYVTPPPTPDGGETSGPTTQERVPKLVSGPPALRINTGNPSLPSTITLATDALSQSDKTAVAAELPAETTLQASVASPTTQSDSLLSTDMDDAFKITIGMMCLNELDLGLDLKGKDESRVGSETQTRPRNQVEVETVKAAPSPADLDSPLASIPRLFSPLSPTAFPLSPQQEPHPVVSAPRTISSPDSTVITATTRSPTREGQRKPSRGRQEERSPQSPETSPGSQSPSNGVPIPINRSSPVPISTSTSTSTPITCPVQSQGNGTKTTTTNIITNATTTTTANENENEKEKTTSRYTKEERMWLHQHYRGEAPFLRAWGLDIKSVADRVEGMGILRDLMGMDSMSD